MNEWLIKRPWKSYTVHEGLPHNWVQTLHHGPDGMVWLGTASGVSRYDGQTFVNFTAKDGSANDHIWEIYGEPNGIMWFGTWDNGVLRYGGERFANLTTKDGLPNNYCHRYLRGSGWRDVVWYTRRWCFSV